MRRFAFPSASDPTDLLVDASPAERARRYVAALWQRPRRGLLYLLRHHKIGAVGLAIVAVVAIAVVFAPLLAPYGATTQDLEAAVRSSSASHFFGTDELGRDVFSRVLYGARVSVGLGVAVVVCAALVGVAAGVVAGFRGGRLDGAIMRIADAFLAFPKLILAMAVAAALGPNLRNTFLAVAATWWPEYARVARSIAVAERHAEFVAAARVLGVSDRRIIRRHIVPSVMGPIVAKATLDVGHAIVYIAGLSFIGFGVRPPNPEWGLMIAQGQNYITTAWWIVMFPGLAILITALGFSLLGESVRDMMDPVVRQDARARGEDRT
jgi:peptide/nickel transport system permease protein